MGKLTNQLLLGAIVSGSMTGSVAVAAKEDPAKNDQVKAPAKDSCKGMNDKNSCKGKKKKGDKDSCKGKKKAPVVPSQEQVKEDAGAGDKNSCGGPNGCGSK